MKSTNTNKSLPHSPFLFFWTSSIRLISGRSQNLTASLKISHTTQRSHSGLFIKQQETLRAFQLSSTLFQAQVTNLRIIMGPSHLVTCPYCGSRLSIAYLNNHVRIMHPYASNYSTENFETEGHIQIHDSQGKNDKCSQNISH